jgi:hypothetical protein
MVTVSWFETAFPEIPPGPPFSKGGEVMYGNSMNHKAFSPFEKGGLRGIWQFFKGLNCYQK